MSTLNLQTRSAKAFLDSITNGDTNLYFFMGRIHAWDNESSPDTVTGTISEHYSVWDSMYVLKKIEAEDISLVVTRNDWEKDSTYTDFDDTDTTLFSGRNFYVLVTDDYELDDNKVYKCIENNSGEASTVEPDSDLTGVFGTTYQENDENYDGYKWIFVYQFNEADADKFLTDDWMPVKKLTTDDSSLHWSAQENAISGGVHSVRITNAGSGYTNGSYSLTVDSLESDGSGLVVSATVTGGVVASVSVINPGQNYTRVSLSMPTSAGGSGAIFRGILSPFGGHGADAVNELKPNAVCVYVLINADEDGKYPVRNDVRQIGIVANPLEIDGTEAGEETYKLHTVMTIGSIINVNADAEFSLDEWVYQGNTLATATAKGRVLDWAAGESLKLINVRGTFTKNSVISGDTSGTKATITSIDSTSEIKPGSGEIVYLKHRTAISRDQNQKEEIKCILEFT